MGNILFLFDVDGTLSKSREKAPKEVLDMLKKIKQFVKIGFVGGSNIEKQLEQIGPSLLDIFDYGFPENGVQYYKGRDLVSTNSIIKTLGENLYKKIVNRLLFLLSEVDCPVKRGTFFELRDSMLNVSPVGRSCSKEERLQFFEYDNKHLIRKGICEVIMKEFPDVTCSIGGQISIDIFPVGWDKTYCLRHVKEEKVYFFGDKTEKGGNDYEIFSHEMVIGTKVEDYNDTIKKVKERLSENGFSYD